MDKAHDTIDQGEEHKMSNAYSGHTSPKPARTAYTIGFYGQQITGHYGEYTSKAAARKAVIAMAKGNATAGQSIAWYVDDLDGNTVHTGTVKGPKQ